jgi:pyridoxamine 5'-phosphate oxidase
MSDPIIPASPSASDYEAQLAANADETIFDCDDPIELFRRWLADARGGEPNDPNAMALATADANGMPDCRMVLLKDVDARGFAFYTNRDSAKGRQMTTNPQAALLFHWKSLRRQVRVRGPIEQGDAAEADAYFASRAREARIGAWASVQSRPLKDRATLEEAVARETARFADQEVGRPGHWGAWRVRPMTLEFWRDRPFRLHDRLHFTRQGDNWLRTRLYP